MAVSSWAQECARILDTASLLTVVAESYSSGTTQTLENNKVTKKKKARRGKKTEEQAGKEAKESFPRRSTILAPMTLCGRNAPINFGKRAPRLSAAVLAALGTGATTKMADTLLRRHRGEVSTVFVEALPVPAPRRNVAEGGDYGCEAVVSSFNHHRFRPTRLLLLQLPAFPRIIGCARSDLFAHQRLSLPHADALAALAAAWPPAAVPPCREGPRA